MPLETAPDLDPNGVRLLQTNISGWLNGATLDAQTWSAPTGITIGNGVATKTTPNGVETPPAPSITSGVVSVFYFSETTAVQNRPYVLIGSFQASDGKNLDKSYRFTLKEL